MKKLMETLSFIAIVFIFLSVLPEDIFNSFVISDLKNIGDGKNGGDNLIIISARLQTFSSMFLTSVIFLVYKKLSRKNKLSQSNFP